MCISPQVAGDSGIDAIFVRPAATLAIVDDAVECPPCSLQTHQWSSAVVLASVSHAPRVTGTEVQPRDPPTVGLRTAAGPGGKGQAP